MEAQKKMTEDHGDVRYQRGLEQLTKVDGSAGENVVKRLAEFAPDFARLLVEFPFGDIYSRPGLDLRSREIATVAMLAAMGSCDKQLAVHIHAALNVGLTKDEILEVLMQVSVYAGFPRALNAIAVAREILGDQSE